MTSYIAQRLVQLVPVAVGISLVVFFLLRLVPGDPALVILGVNATPESLAAVHERLGLDRSLPEQFAIFATGALRGDLGFSYFYHASVLGVVLERLPLTIILMAYSVVLCVAVAIPLAIVGALNPESAGDHVVRVALTLGNSVPRYWLGMVLILFFALRFPLFPISVPGDTLPHLLYSLFLPALTTALGQFPTLCRALRANLIETLESDFVYTARAKGLPERAVFARHALRASLIPAVTILGANMSFLVGGQLVVENVFGLAGLGNLMLTGIASRDYPIVQAATLVFAVLVVAVNLMTDLVVAMLDPRIRLGS